MVPLRYTDRVPVWTLERTMLQVTRDTIPSLPPGVKVAAFTEMNTETKLVKFLGIAEDVGRGIPDVDGIPTNIARAQGHTCGMLKLENGDIVYSVECYIMPVEQYKALVAERNLEVVVVKIADERKKGIDRVNGDPLCGEQYAATLALNQAIQRKIKADDAVEARDEAAATDALAANAAYVGEVARRDTVPGPATLQ